MSEELTPSAHPKRSFIFPALFKAIPLLLFLGSQRISLSQQIIAPPPEDFAQKVPIFVPAGTNLTAMPPLTPVQELTIPEWLQWGPVRVRPHILERVLYGDGIPARPGEQFKTTINEFAPGVLFDLGDLWRLDYTPTLRFYSSSQFRDTLDHSVLLNGGTIYEDWSFGLSQTYSLSSQPLAETAGQTDTETFVTAINAAYQMSSRLSLEFALNQNFRFVGENPSASQLNDSREWSTLNWLNCQFFNQFGAAIGLGGGYVNVSTGPDMTYEQAQGRLNWHPGDKLSLLVNGGVDYRQFLDSNAPDLLNPIYGLSALYQITSSTTFSLNGSRSVSASYFQSQVTEATALAGTLRQRFLGKLFLEVSGGYQWTTYKETILTPFVIFNLNRKDEYPYINVRLTATMLKRGSVAVFFQASDNHSNVPSFDYSSRQVGVEIGYRL
jgi:hypothetical protein